MREIKFRGKRYGDGAWVYGSLYQGIKEGEKYSIILTDSGYHLAPPDDRNLAIAFAENEVNVVIPDTIGQFTGLHDRNGKEIYEGDIVKWILTMPGVGVNGGYEEYEIEEIGEIQWDAGALHLGEYCAAGFAYESKDYAEIIGNIHDNPELLKTEKLWRH